jgi:hypothetical protein
MAPLLDTRRRSPRLAIQISVSFAARPVGNRAADGISVRNFMPFRWASVRSLSRSSSEKSVSRSISATSSRSSMCSAYFARQRRVCLSLGFLRAGRSSPGAFRLREEPARPLGEGRRRGRVLLPRGRWDRAGLERRRPERGRRQEKSALARTLSERMPPPQSNCRAGKMPLISAARDRRLDSSSEIRTCAVVPPDGQPRAVRFRKPGSAPAPRPLRLLANGRARR